MAVPLPSKAVLRKELKARRDRHFAAVSFAERCTASILLRDRVASAIGEAQTVAVYLPIGSEIDPYPLIDSLHADGVRLALPHVTRSRNPMRFLAWAPGELLVAGPMDLAQPDPQAPELIPDMILTPLLGFDRRRNRIGYGAGFYDRAFAAHPAARRIGLAWSWQECSDIHIDPWDVPLHAVATELELIG